MHRLPLTNRHDPVHATAWMLACFIAASLGCKVPQSQDTKSQSAREARGGLALAGHDAKSDNQAAGLDVIVFHGTRDDAGELLKMDCLDVPGGTRDVGAQLEIWTCNGGKNQIFSLTWLPEKAMGLVAKESGLCLAFDGSTLVQEACDESKPSQRFGVATISASTFKLSVADNRCLAIDAYRKLDFAACGEQAAVLALQAP